MTRTNQVFFARILMVFILLSTCVLIGTKGVGFSMTDSVGTEENLAMTGSVETEENLAVTASAGIGHTMILKTDGTLWGFGRNSVGQLGDGTNIYRDTPVKIMEGVRSVSAGSVHTMILKTDGTLWACGSNEYGQLGLRRETTKSFTPVKIMEGVRSVSAGYNHTMIVKTDGTLWSCGENYFGQLGNGDMGIAGRDYICSIWLPTQVMEDVRAVSAGSVHTMILKTDGTLWGCGIIGPFGDGSRYLTPVQVMEDVSAVSAGVHFTMILKTDGTLWGCGHNYVGQLGDGTNISRDTLVKVMEGVRSVSAGKNHTMILKTDGTLWACGRNAVGQLGDGTLEDSPTPIQVMEDVSAVSAISTGYESDSDSYKNYGYTLILKTDGTLWTCGSDYSGQPNPTPVQVMDEVMLPDGSNAVEPTLTEKPSSWAEAEVSAAVDAGLVPDYLRYDFTYPTTRAEFCALAVQVYEGVTGAEITERKKFDDTNSVEVEKMAALGVVNGMGDNEFAPNEPLTREQAATMLSRLAEVLEKPLPSQPSTFADNDSISTWAIDSVGQVQVAGIMGGVGNNTFSPTGAYTREQSIMTMLRLYRVVKE